MENDRDQELPRAASHRHGFYSLQGNHSSVSVFEDVEMAHDELYSGPMAESLPTSVSAFRHRRSRADSTASFSFYQEEDELNDPIAIEERRIADLDELPFDDELDEEEDSADLERNAEENDYVLHRRASTQSRGDSVHSMLLRRDSGTSAGSGYGSNRHSQKAHIQNEDLYIAIAGFRTSKVGYAIYLFLCLSTLGIGWLIFYWSPKWRVKLVGRSALLRECEWVVVENSWNEMATVDVVSKEYGRTLSTVFGTPSKLTSYLLDDDPDPILPDLRYIDYRHIRFFFHPVRDKFLICNGWKDPLWTDVQEIRNGIDSEEHVSRRTVFGTNDINIEKKTIGQLLVKEVFHPFYVFQVASLVLWSLDEYYYYACAIFLISAISIIQTLIETRQTERRLRDISRFECDVRICRHGFWSTILSSDLVPGDVYEVSDPRLTQFPADSILLSGDCIVNESMLTGESIPVTKTPATNETLRKLDLNAPTPVAEVAKHTLFCGTKIIRARRPQNEDDQAVALAMVIKTGFNTTKGALVRSMLFPKPSGFKFYRDSFRYIGVMAIVAAIGFLASIVNFIHLGLAWHEIIIRALDLITIVVPPALPATLTIGTTFAVRRLKRQNIFCTSPQRVQVGGKLDIMCFDKTGTLTEEGLDILGVHLVSRDTNRFMDLIENPDDLAIGHDQPPAVGGKPDTRSTALFTMATCHTLRKVGDEMLGEPLELKMFEFTKWSFEEGDLGGGGDDEEQGTLKPSIARPPPGAKSAADGNGEAPSFELGVLKSFEFVSHLRRASVIVKDFGKPSGDIYVKGSPECMREICRPETFPDDYDEILGQYTRKGYRVIACASRHIKRLSWVKAQKMRRHDVESDLEFVGFIIFENKLKPTTAAVLKELGDSNIGTVMVTGDNILTAISVARESGMISETAHCFYARFATGHTKDPNAELQWESIDNSIYRLDPRTLLPLPAPAEADASLPYDVSNLRNYTIAVSGDVFRWVVDYAPADVMQRMLVTGKVFARMSPDEKHELVDKLQSIDYSCGFCGDGANDCGALKAADVGISLSEAEASVAAPFTSRVFDITCVPKVIREGRAALVTSFACFKYMSLYSAIQFTTVSFLYASASNLGDFQFLYIDLALILPIAVFMGWANPFPKLCRKKPIADLVSRKVLAPLLCHMVICILIQTITFVAVRKVDWFIPPTTPKPGEKPDVENSEVTALFLVSCFQYVLAGWVLNAGRPFREVVWKNWPFLATMVAALALSAFMVVAPPEWLPFMRLTPTSWDFKLVIFALGAVAYFALAWTGEHFVFQRLGGWIGKVKAGLTKQAKKRKEYKVILEKMRF
ncbi:putative type V cation-transporting ATPase [Triangularia verruculosa]|uniref:Cation-transporting ATPase n=1 Tax=Triangularia verruculosa TaxID=2587418 RepID=A0AAN6XNI9_9PEZI|nr:putative type V cation-transporting ATPase [Triangularia verruculosa]